MEAETKDTCPDFLKKVMSEPSPEKCVEIGQVNKENFEWKQEKGIPDITDLEVGDLNQDDLAGTGGAYKQWWETGGGRGPEWVLRSFVCYP